MDRQINEGRLDVPTASALTSGPPRYAPKGPWRPGAALTWTIVLLVVTLLIGVLVGVAVISYATGVSIENFGDREYQTMGLIGTGILQVITIGLVWWLAGWRGGVRREVLQIDGRKPTPAEIGLAIVGQTVVLGLFLGLFYLYDSERLMANYRSDVAPYIAVMRDPNAWLIVPPLLFLAIVLAPVSEELLFRGFLLSGLAKGRWGFWAPAILSIVIWTALHGYSLTGTLTVVIYGLYFSWLLWRTGQLWLSLICHAFANVVAMAFVGLYAWG